jgi:LmbE family N-acetylglucosaminyl deacetylase
MENNLYRPASVLVIVAHPDDIEFSCAGTMARWAREGTKICYVLCTSGEVGIAKSGMTKARAAEIREAEQREAARLAGVQEVVFLREPDGMLQPTLELRKKLVREIRRFRPEAVFTGDPTVVWASDTYINHPDHRAAATAALDAVFPAAGQPNLFEELAAEGLAAHKPRKVFVTSWDDSANHYVNIAETIEIKIAALKAHTSQMGDWDPTEMMRSWAAEAGKGKEMPYAEGFRVITLVSDDDWEKNHGQVLDGQALPDEARQDQEDA